MENASKALMIAGAVLITLALVSIFMYIFAMINDLRTQPQAQQKNNEINAFNRFFVESSYDINQREVGVQIKGYDAYNLVGKANDVNDDLNSPVEIVIVAPQEIISPAKENLKISMEKIYNYKYILDSEGYVKEIHIN